MGEREGMWNGKKERVEGDAKRDGCRWMAAWLSIRSNPLDRAGYPRYPRRSLSLITCSALINSFVIDYRGGGGGY